MKPEYIGKIGHMFITAGYLKFSNSITLTGQQTEATRYDETGVIELVKFATLQALPLVLWRLENNQIAAVDVATLVAPTVEA